MTEVQATPNIIISNLEQSNNLNANLHFNKNQINSKLIWGSAREWTNNCGCIKTNYHWKFTHFIKEKISYNVPFFYGRKGICIVWPAAIPRGGIKEGVLLGFWHGNKLIDSENYLTHGSNKQIFYKIFKHVKEIDEVAIVKLLKESVRVDGLHGLKKKFLIK